MVRNMTRYYFKFNTGALEAPMRVQGDVLEEDSAIANSYEHAVRIMINGYGNRVANRLALVKEEPIELYKPATKMAKPSDSELAEEFLSELEEGEENETF